MITLLKRAVLLCVAAVAGVATAAPADEDVTDLFQQAQKIQETYKAETAPDWLQGKTITPEQRVQIEEISKVARDISEKAIAANLDENHAITGPEIKGEHIEILVSFSLGKDALREILQNIAEEPRASAVFRGLPRDVGTREGIAMIQALAKDINPPPRILIDPTRFRKINTDRVPTIAVYDGEDLLISASGITGIRYMRARLRAGDKGDIGTRGPVTQASEPDMIELIQQRLASMDMKKYAEGARDRYWEKISHTDIPQATSARTRHIDPTVVVTADISDADGKVIVPKGKRINPLDEMAFSQRLIIFDASSKEQVMLVQTLKRQYSDKRVTLIAARLDQATGWEGYRKLQNDLRGAVYVLTPEVQSRFQIERLPSVVESSGKEFLVHEFPPQEETAQAGKN
jgi:conjugal transfer pilus assembly protein TraW